LRPICARLKFRRKRKTITRPLVKHCVAPRVVVRQTFNMVFCGLKRIHRVNPRRPAFTKPKNRKTLFHLSPLSNKVLIDLLLSCVSSSLLRPSQHYGRFKISALGTAFHNHWNEFGVKVEFIKKGLNSVAISQRLRFSVIGD
jgi:hypothetical protein